MTLQPRHRVVNNYNKSRMKKLCSNFCMIVKYYIKLICSSYNGL